MTDLARLLVRLVVGGLVAGHGAQKLFGWFGGPGPEGTAGMMEQLELGPLGIIGSMTMATTKVHWGKPIWVTSGGAELPITNIAAAAALALVGPGRYSIDHALGIRLPRWVGILGLVAIALTVGRAAQPPQPVQSAPEGTARETMPEEELIPV